jgi:hypothetical protein
MAIFRKALPSQASDISAKQRNIQMRMIISALALLAGVSIAGTALAESESCGDAPKSQWLSEQAIKEKAVAQGFDVRQVKVEGSCYEIKAFDKNGARVERVVNPVTGEVVAKEEGE